MADLAPRAFYFDPAVTRIDWAERRHAGHREPRVAAARRRRRSRRSRRGLPVARRSRLGSDVRIEQQRARARALGCAVEAGVPRIGRGGQRSTCESNRSRRLGACAAGVPRRRTGDPRTRVAFRCHRRARRCRPLGGLAFSLPLARDARHAHRARSVAGARPGRCPAPRAAIAPGDCRRRRPPRPRVVRGRARARLAVSSQLRPDRDVLAGRHRLAGIRVVARLLAAADGPEPRGDQGRRGADAARPGDIPPDLCCGVD